ncbi:MAG: hypothetical protein AB7O88_20045 [Reyranellaceae bacterium]
MRPSTTRGTQSYVLALVLALPLAPGAQAQDGQHGVGHAAHHEWYKTLISPQTGASCCNNEDCRPTRAYVDDDGAWHALLDGQWISVPREKVLNTKAPDGNSHICANQFGMIFCFVGGVPKS